MQRTLLRAKIHNAVITETELTYDGSITIDGSLMDRVGVLDGERVQVVNLNNGSRLETYVIRGGEDSGVICLNGPAARLGMVGDTVHILAYAVMDEAEARQFQPVIVILDGENRIGRIK